MADSRKLIVEIIGDTRSVEKAFRKTDKQAQTFGNRVGGAMRGVAKGAAFAAGAAGIGGLVATLKIGIDEFTEATKVQAQTQAVLKSTGRIANVTADDVDKLATQIMNLSGIDDEAVKSGENLLLTFKNVRNEVGRGNRIFDRATRAAVDLSVAGFGSLEGTAKLMGKALNDPLRGLTALTRAGVTFTEKQRDTIKRLVETNRTLEAQKIILREVESQVGGSAKALGDTLPGKLNKLRETFGNLAGVIVAQYAPAVERQIDRATKWIQNAENQKKVTDAVTKAVKVVSDVIKALVPVVQTIARVVETLTGALGGTKNAVYLLISAFVAFKALKMAASIGLITTSLTGPAGLVAAAGLASFALTSMILKATGLDGKLKTLGGTVRGLTDRLGITNDPGEQFRGKTNLSQQAAGFLRQRARRLIAAGLSPGEAAQRLVATHPRVALRDAQVLAGVTGSPINVHTTVVLDGAAVGRSVTRHQQRRSRHATKQRRGPFADQRIQ